MRTIIIIMTYLICFTAFSQKINTQYFLINKNDTLITKLTNSKGDLSGYKINNNNKIIKEYIRTSEINGNDIEVDVFDSILFSYKEKDGKIVDESYIKKIDIIETRKEFLKINAQFDETKNRFVFIEPFKCGKFIMREVRPIIFE